MNDNIVKLVFRCVSTGSGWADLKKRAADSIKDMGHLSGAMKAVGTYAGAMGGMIGRALGAFAMGNVWGLATEGARLLIDKLGLFKDRSEEAKKQFDKLEESARKFYETINANTQKSIENIDKETNRRNEQLDITNRMIKAELQLQKARAISSGDTAGVERIDRQVAELDQKTEIQKARYSADSAAKRRDEAEVKMAATIAAEAKAAKELSDAESQYQKAKERSYYLTGGGPNGIGPYSKVYTEPEAEKAAVEAARKRLELAKQQTVAAKEAYGVERDKYELAVANVKAIEAEQKAADENALAQKMAAAMKAEKERVAAEKKAIQDLADEDAKKERERLQKEAEDAKRKAIEELQAEVEARNKARQDALRKDIEADRQRVAELEARLADARAAVPATIDVLGNAAGMDQAGGLRGERQAGITDSRFNDRFTKLLTSGRIKKDANGNWKIDGRASNLDKAVLDRLNANEKVKRAEAQAAKERQRLEKMEGYLKTISETIKTATEI